MPAEPNYVCSSCSKPTPREELTVKKAVFLEIGERARTLKSRVTDWLCPNCVANDKDWQRPAYQTPFSAPSTEKTLPIRQEANVGQAV